MLPAARWYFDADTVGPGKVLSHVRKDVTWPGDTGERPGPARRWLPRGPVPESDTIDEVWIPLVAQAGMTIITRDKHIQTRLSELQAVRDSGARMFAVTSKENLDRWGLLEVIVNRWRDMERLVQSEPGPFIYSLTRAGGPRRVL